MPELPPGAALPEVLAFIHAQLDSIDPAQTLQQQFKLVGRGHRRTGAQSIVAFATSAFSRHRYVFKFFSVRASFDTETALRGDRALAQLMPVIQSVHDPLAPEHDNMPVADRWGRTLPPCIVMARGESLVDWLQRATPDIFQAASVVAHVAACLRQIHAAGYVHGAVKPAHILLHSELNRWALADFDRAAVTGTVKPPEPVLPYAPPEVVTADASGHHGVVVDPSQDAWALGVVAFELLTGRNAFDDEAEGEEEVTAQLLGKAPLPWEGPQLTDDTMHRLGIFADLVLGLLRRDPALRLSMMDFCNGCYDIVASHTTTTAPV